MAGRISVVLPAFNEAGSIRFSVITTQAILAELVEEFEIIVVSDGSTDGTDREIEDLIGRYGNLRLIHKPTNEGYGFALPRRVSRGAISVPVLHRRRPASSTWSA